MQLFTFGHPCEHQLKRVCIGGTSCPLNGYPDHWCCSFVKGKINFKRDKPCEGTRCRWGFAHPPDSSFNAVTLVLNEGRACAAKMEEGYGTGLLHGGPYTITSPHAADVAHCALNMLRTPPVRVAPRVGGLLAFAAVKAGDAKVFTQLLKTMKKPVDDYLIGAFEYIQSMKGKAAKGEGTVIEDLRHDVLEIMRPALSHHGELINRPEQQPLQTYYIAALKTATRNKKKFSDAAELASASFPEAVAKGCLVKPESWTKVTAPAKEADGSDADSAAASTPAAAPAAPQSTTPLASPTAPAASVTPLKTAVTPASSPVAEKKPATPAHSASQPVGAKLASGTPAEKRTVPVPPAPRSSEARAAAQPAAAAASPSKDKAPGKAPSLAIAPPKTPVSVASSAASTPTTHPKTPEFASLVAACDAAGRASVDAYTFNDFPGFYSVREPRYEPAVPVFGGLFALDVNPARCSPMTEVTDFHAPLGPATRPDDTIAAWRSNAQVLAASESDAERKKELEAAAAALAAADVVLESMSMSA